MLYDVWETFGRWEWRVGHNLTQKEAEEKAFYVGHPLARRKIKPAAELEEHCYA